MTQRPIVSDVLEFLRGLGLVAGTAPDVGSRGALPVADVRADLEAGPASLSWLSERNAQADGGRAAAFRGALLLAPEGAAGTGETPGVVLPCTRPKLAFSRAVYQFFPELVETEFPAAGEPGVGPAARVGAGTRLAAGVVLGPGVEIGAGCVIGPNTVLAHTRVGDGVRIGANCTIGLPGYGYERDGDGVPYRFPHVGGVRIGRGAEIGSNVCVDRGALGDTEIGEDCKVDNLVHVAHNVVLEPECMVIANAMLGGSVRVGRGAWISPSASVINQVEVGAHAVVGMGAVVIRPVAAGRTVIGNPGRELRKNGED